MKAEDKPKFVKEARELLESLDVEKLKTDPNDFTEIKKINRLIVIFTNFSSNDGEKLNELFLVFQHQARASTKTGTINNRAVDMLQFIDQKIEAMDVYRIEESIQKQQERIVKNLKNDKYWTRSNLEGKDLHIFVGERGDKSGSHVHLVSDSDTGELRVDPGDKSPQELIERAVAVTMKGGTTVGVGQSGVRTTMEFFSQEVASNSNVPALYVKGIRRSGGPTGQFELITIKNVGKETALDVIWGVRGFDFEWMSADGPFELEPGQEKEVEFVLSDHKVWKEEVKELNVIMECKDYSGNSYFSRRELKQENVKSGDFFELSLGTFHPAVLLVDDGLSLSSGPIHDGDQYYATFTANTSSGQKQVKISISKGFLAVWGFETESQIKQALLELGHRMIRKMVKNNQINDYLFVATSFPDDFQAGFEGYVKTRDSI